MKKTFFPFLIPFLFFVSEISFAQTQIQISPTLPNSIGTYSAASAGPSGFIANFYGFALLIGGILAFGAVVYGGIKYLISAGNPSAQGEGKEWIESALTGLLLLAGAYIILYTINPALVNLGLPELTSLNIPASAPSGGGTGTGTGTGGTGTYTPYPATGCAGGTCDALPNCTDAARTSCGGAQGMVDALTCINQSFSNYTVNEGYPPTPGVTHSDPKHNNGCAVDLHVSCGNIPALTAAAQSCENGGNVSSYLNEYSTDPTTGCGTNGGTPVLTTTGGNFHIDATGGGC